MRYLLLLAVCTTPGFGQESPSAPTPLPPGHSFSDKPVAKIRLEFRFVSAPSESLAELKTKSLIRTAPFQPELALDEVPDEQLAKSGGIQLVSAKSVTEIRQPVFIDTFDDTDVRSVLHHVQENERANVFLAPKLTLIDRQTATIEDITKHPFVVGLKPANESYTPQIETLRTGYQVVVRCRSLSDDLVRIDFRARFSNVDDVTTRSAGPPSTSVQVPEVTSNDVQVSAKIPSGRTLAVWGLPLEIQGSKNDSGQPLSNIPYVNHMFKNTGETRVTLETLLLVTPRLVEAE